MKHAFLLCTALAAITPTFPAFGDAPAPVEIDPKKLFLVPSVEQAKGLPAGTDAVRVVYSYGLHQGGVFVAIMKELATNPTIRHLRLELPNSSHIRTRDLDVLKEFKTLESFDLEDDRDFSGDEILTQTAAMPKLKKVALEFG